jgi:hypothetical protein
MKMIGVGVATKRQFQKLVGRIGNGPSTSTFSATTLHDFFIDHQGVVNFRTNDKDNNNNNDLASNSNLNSNDSNASPVETSSSSQFHRHENHNSSHRRINHRHAAKDWLHNIASIPKSTVLKDIRNPVLSIASWSTLISIIHAVLSKLSKSSTNSNLFQHIASKMCIGTQMHSLMISSLGLLLVFRTNSAYQRFVEGRKIWEQISGISRNLDRMVNLYSDEIGQSKVKRIKH